MSQVDIKQITDNIHRVRGEIDLAAKKAGRDPQEITLVAVSKTFPSEAIEFAVAAGVSDLGESRVQEATGKIDELGRIARWHLVGHLQSNKAAAAVKYFDMIQSIDSIGLAEKVSQQAIKQGKTIDCLLEVNSSGEINKFGFSPSDLILAGERVIRMPGINLRGIMTIGPWTTNDCCVRKAFDVTHELFQKTISSLGPGIETLSMGMSSDFGLAIECGSTMVRVGTGIFGDRQKINK